MPNEIDPQIQQAYAQFSRQRGLDRSYERASSRWVKLILANKSEFLRSALYFLNYRHPRRSSKYCYEEEVRARCRIENFLGVKPKIYPLGYLGYNFGEKEFTYGFQQKVGDHPFSVNFRSEAIWVKTGSDCRELEVRTGQPPLLHLADNFHLTVEADRSICPYGLFIWEPRLTKTDEPHLITIPRDLNVQWERGKTLARVYHDTEVVV